MPSFVLLFKTTFLSQQYDAVYHLHFVLQSSDHSASSFHGIVLYIFFVFRRSNHYTFLHIADTDSTFSINRFSNNSFQLWFGIKILCVVIACFSWFFLVLGVLHSALCMPLDTTYILYSFPNFVQRVCTNWYV